MRIGYKFILDTGFQVGVADLAKALHNSLEPDELILAWRQDVFLRPTVTGTRPCIAF